MPIKVQVRVGAEDVYKRQSMKQAHRCIPQVSWQQKNFRSLMSEPVEGVSMKDSLFGTVDSVVSGQKTVDEWKAAVNKANDALRGAMK